MNDIPEVAALSAQERLEMVGLIDKFAGVLDSINEEPRIEQAFRAIARELEATAPGE